jgi:NTE family protein
VVRAGTHTSVPSKSSRPGIIGAEKVFARVRDLLEGVKIEDLPIPFTAVATDLVARKSIWFQRNPVETAVRASIAMPGVFTPLMLNGRVLLDGGLMDPVPVAAHSIGARRRDDRRRSRR